VTCTEVQQVGLTQLPLAAAMKLHAAPWLIAPGLGYVYIRISSACGLGFHAIVQRGFQHVRVFT
jgi:hypothetical protein